MIEWLRSFFRAPLAPVTGHEEDALLNLVIDGDGWLSGEGVELVPSVRHSPLGPAEPLGIVWHYTATDPGTARSLARRIRTYRKNHDRPASWHVLIGVDGTLWQSVSMERGAWHCAKGDVQGYRPNASTIGVELEGHGQVFPPAQRNAAERLISAILDRYTDISLPDLMLQHSSFDPTRRKDPGPVWMELLRPMVERQWQRFG